MRFPGKATVAGLSLTLTAGTGWAAEVCARAPDLVALQVAALQQQLMVAALTCDDVSLYNSFVITYQKDLQDSDAALQAFFDRFGGADGSPAYHAFKTKMANLYSSRSAADKPRFCASARASFAPALKAEKMNLASFAMSQPTSFNEPYANCGETVAGGAMVARTPAVAPPPRPGNLLIAQSAASAAKSAAEEPAPSSQSADKPLAAALPADPPKTAAEPPSPAASSGAVAAATTGAGTASSGGQTTLPSANPERSTARSALGRFGSEAYRERYAQQRLAQERLAQQRLAEQRLAQQRAAQRSRVRRDPYDPRGYYWPADPYWEYCYTRYGGRMPCAEAAQRYRSNRYYYRAPYDGGGYPPRW
jgi:hypothetical protein